MVCFVKSPAFLAIRILSVVAALYGAQPATRQMEQRRIVRGLVNAVQGRARFLVTNLSIDINTWLARLAVVALLGTSITAVADWLEPRTARDLPGTHHASFRLQVVDHEGAPVQTRVTLSAREPGFRGYDLPIAETSTSPDGKAEFADVSSRFPLVLTIAGSLDLRPHHQFLPNLTHGMADLGEVTLKRNFIVSGVIYGKDANGIRQRLDAEVELVSTDTGRTFAWNSAPWTNGVFRLEDFDLRPSNLEIERWSDERGRLLHYGVPFVADPDKLHRHFLLTLPHEDASDQTVLVEEAEWPEGVPPLESPRLIEGRVVTASGGPAAGLRVEGHWRDSGATMGRTDTDADGRFSMEAVGDQGLLLVPAPGGSFRFPIDTDRLELASPERQKVVVRGERASRMHYGWLFRGEWLPIPPELLPGDSSRAVGPALVRAEAPGRIDRLVAYPSSKSTLEFDFRGDESYRLRVVDRGEPVAGAIVEVFDAAPPPASTWFDSYTPVRLNTAVAGADGRVSLAGDPKAHYVAYVYAPGYEPARVRWDPGAETWVELVPRNVSVRFDGLGGGARLRLKVAGRDTLVTLRRIAQTGPVVVKLAPGSYDATVEDRHGTVLRGTSVHVVPGMESVDMRPDRRPRVVVRLGASPTAPDWFVSATRKIPPHGSVGALARSYFGSGPLVQGLALEADSPDSTTRVLVLPGSGRWLVQVNAWRELDHALFAEVDLEAGEGRDLVLPHLDASLEASISFGTGTDSYPHHGFAGPRMMLLSTAGTGNGWHVVVSRVLEWSAESAGCRPIALERLPPGEYHLFHHLVDHDAWGGVEVALESGETTSISGLGRGDTGRLTVKVVDPGGRPVSGPVLRIRDRMHEAWSAFIASARSTDVFAAKPIPPPPAKPLRGGSVTFEGIRAGWLELVVDDPAGPVRHYLRKVEPGRTLRLVVDP